MEKYGCRAASFMGGLGVFFALSGICLNGGEKNMWVRKWRRNCMILLAVATVFTVILFVVVENNIYPVLMSMAEARVQAVVVQVMNSAAREVLSDTEGYADLVKVLRDPDSGKVLMVQTDALQLNELATRTSLLAQQNIAEMGLQGVKIPIGSVTGSRIFAGRGPNINVRIVPVGSVTTEFSSEFENAGINQTRYRVVMKATANVRIVIPTGSKGVMVDSLIPITEAIIVGEVPEGYVNVAQGGDGMNYSQMLADIMQE